MTRVARFAVAAVAASLPLAAALGQASVSGLLAPAQQSDVVALQMQTSQSADRVLDASGNDTWTFPNPFSATPRLAYFPQNSDVSGKPIVCNWQTRSATSVTYHCDKSAGLLASLLTPVFASNGAAGATVTVIARGTLASAP